MKASFLFCVVLLLLGACGPTEKTPEAENGSASTPIIGGSTAAESDFPATGALLRKQNGKWSAYCTATLISPTVLLTAGHCVNTRISLSPTPGFSLLRDVTQIADAQVLHTVKRLPHPSFNLNAPASDGAGRWFDIALLFLEQPITHVVPATLASTTEAQQLAQGLMLTLAGYGYTVSGGPQTGVLSKAQAPLETVGDYELDVGHAGTPQNCNGDSGGPAFAPIGPNGELRLVGIVSRGRGPGARQCTTGGTDTRVDAYEQWVNDVLNPLVPPDAGTVTPDAGTVKPDAGMSTCRPKTCFSFGGSPCGQLPDGCGGTVECGGCAEGLTCGAEKPNACGVVGTCNVECDPIQNTGCAAGLSCKVFYGGSANVTKCVPEGTLTQVMPLHTCDRNSAPNKSCGPGFGCHAGLGVCMKVCDPASAGTENKWGKANSADCPKSAGEGTTCVYKDPLNNVTNCVGRCGNILSSN